VSKDDILKSECYMRGAGVSKGSLAIMREKRAFTFRAAVAHTLGGSPHEPPRVNEGLQEIDQKTPVDSLTSPIAVDQLDLCA
jgi:hypothetical protein